MTITSRRRLLIPLAALALLAGCAGQPGQPASSSSSSSSSSSGNGTDEVTSYAVDPPAGTISLEAHAGGVTVHAKDGAITVTERARYTDNKPVTSHTVNGGNLELHDQGCPNRSSTGPCQVSWDITAPAGTVLDLRTHAGSVELRGMSGAVTVRCESGGVQGHELRSRRVQATGNSGTISLEFAEAPDDVAAETRAGAVLMSLPSGTGYDVQAETRAGHTGIGVQRDSASPHKIRAKAGAGAIEIRNG